MLLKFDALIGGLFVSEVTLWASL